MPTYDKAYFIAKFEAIPDGKWCTRTQVDDDGRCCALGHCSRSLGAMSKEGHALAMLFEPTRDEGGKLVVARINDGEAPRYQQTTPRARVLAALRDLP